MTKRKVDLSSLGSVKFQAHLKMRVEGITKRHKIQRVDARGKALDKLAERLAEAQEGKAPGQRFPYPIGGSYQLVASFNSQHRDVCYMEANHTPAVDAYVDSPFEALVNYDQKPAHAMMFYHHRKPKGVPAGGASSTGGSGVNKAWSAEKIRNLMIKGDFGEAMYWDMVDLTNTTYPNRGYYALSLLRAAYYARRIGLLDDAGLSKITVLLGDYLPAEQISQAAQDSEVAVAVVAAV